MVHQFSTNDFQCIVPQLDSTCLLLPLRSISIILHNHHLLLNRHFVDSEWLSNDKEAQQLDIRLIQRKSSSQWIDSNLKFYPRVFDLFLHLSLYMALSQDQRIFSWWRTRRDHCQYRSQWQGIMFSSPHLDFSNASNRGFPVNRALSNMTSSL